MGFAHPLGGPRRRHVEQPAHPRREAFGAARGLALQMPRSILDGSVLPGSAGLPRLDLLRH